VAEPSQPIDGEAAARVLVGGASGFAGALAAELVWLHPRLELKLATARSEAGTRLDRLYPRYRAAIELTELDLEAIDEVDVAIVSYPHGAAAPVVAALRGLGVQVVDLSADFRIRALPTHEKWYGPHGAPDLLENAVYGLTELYRDQLADAELVANPGCYPTAAVLALAPLAESGLIASVAIDAKSGVSGAGRGDGDRLHFVNVDENLGAYGVDGHRHQPEIEQELTALGMSAPLTFIPHLVPIDQGLLVSCHVELGEDLGSDELDALFTERYGGERFIEVVEAPPGVRDVRDTNLCRISVARVAERRAVVFGAIDNLWKGAAGQAIQNLNLMLGMDEGEGLR